MADVIDPRLADATTFLRNHGIPSSGPEADRVAAIGRLKSPHDNRAQQITKLAVAYALFLRYGTNSGIQKALRAIGGRTKTATPIRIFVEAVTGVGTDARVAEKRYSRNCRAIEYLNAQKLLPSRVEAEGAKLGVGITYWAKPQKTKAAEKKAALASNKSVKVTSNLNPDHITINEDGALQTYAIKSTKIDELKKKIIKWGTPI